MFGIGSTELLVILLVALIVLGPKSLAKVSRSLGKAMGEFRRVSTDFQRTLNAESAEADLREREATRRKAAADAGTDAGVEAPKDTAAQPAPAPEAAPAQVPGEADEADGLTPPEGSPLAEALERARAEAEAATHGNSPENAPAAAAASPASPTPPADGPRA